MTPHADQASNRIGSGEERARKGLVNNGSLLRAVAIRPRASTGNLYYPQKTFIDLPTCRNSRALGPRMYQPAMTSVRTLRSTLKTI